jgi:hypothetical protein
MPKGIRNIVLINGAVAIFYVLAFVLYYRTHVVFEMRVLPVAAAFVALITGPVLMLGSVLVWRIVRILCYAFALLTSMFVVTAFFKGFILSVPIQIALLIVFNIYLIGVRGYLNSDVARTYFKAGPIKE